MLRMTVFELAAPFRKESAKKVLASLSDSQHHELAMMHLEWAELLGDGRNDAAGIMMDYLEENGFDRLSWFGMCHEGY